MARLSKIHLYKLLESVKSSGVPRIFTDKEHAEISSLELQFSDEEDSAFLEYIRTCRININIRQDIYLHNHHFRTAVRVKEKLVERDLHPNPSGSWPVDYLIKLAPWVSTYAL
ncbi:hypothetical protein HAX54_033409 [Datura stramonium]|uniref:Uncharacterized protein n=1 Tax=Datura stramonium TaxID=4076 RepID=A0ABS8VCA6_DATST|nr:hypothetical protein [Datura stramonium]